MNPLLTKEFVQSKAAELYTSHQWGGSKSSGFNACVKLMEIVGTGQMSPEQGYEILTNAEQRQKYTTQIQIDREESQANHTALLSRLEKTGDQVAEQLFSSLTQSAAVAAKIAAAAEKNELAAHELATVVPALAENTKLLGQLLPVLQEHLTLSREQIAQGARLEAQNNKLLANTSRKSGYIIGITTCLISSTIWLLASHIQKKIPEIAAPLTNTLVKAEFKFNGQTIGNPVPPKSFVPSSTRPWTNSASTNAPSAQPKP